MMTTRMMMALAAGLFLAVGSARAMEQVGGKAAAVDVKVADDAWNGGGRFSGVDYGTSERLGRAWLVLHYRFFGPCGAADGWCELDAPVEVAVPGLSYDVAQRRIVFRDAGAEPVVCADVKLHGGFLGFGDKIAPTGRCTVRGVRVDRIVDDGFEGRRDRREELHFAVLGR